MLKLCKVHGLRGRGLGSHSQRLNAKAGHQIASKFGNCFTKHYDRLAGHPESGPPRPALGPNIRIGIVPPFIVINRYIEGDDVVTVLRIVHGHRKIAGKLLTR